MKNLMDFNFPNRLLIFIRQKKGAVAVEFAFVITLLMLIVGGVIDFGHYLYLRQVATNASRDGARYGSLYSNSTSNHATAAQIQSYIQQKYGPSLGYSAGTGPTVTATGAGGASGTDLTVTVTGSKQWFLLDSLISSNANANALRHPAGVTVMKLE
jgi:Flp pilus assembly protein TadG